MSYPVKLYFFLFVFCVAAVVMAVKMAPLGLVVLVVCAIVMSYLAILIGRWLFGRKNL